MEQFTVDPTVYTGRPADKRDSLEEDCYDLLDGLGIPYWRVDHDPADSVEKCRAVGAVLDVPVCKNLFLRNRTGTDFYLLMMPGDKPFRTAAFSARMGIPRVSFASPEQLMQYLRLAPGSVSILGLQYDTAVRVRLCIDGELMRGEYMRCHPNRNTSTLRLRTEDVRTRLLPYLRHRPMVVELPDEQAER